MTQAATIFVTLGVAIGGGIVTGLILQVIGKINRLKHDAFFNDRPFWNEPVSFLRIPVVSALLAFLLFERL